MKAFKNTCVLNIYRKIETIEFIKKSFAEFNSVIFNKGNAFCINKNLASFYSIGASLAIIQLKGGWSNYIKYFPYRTLLKFRPSTKVGFTNADLILYVKEKIDQVFLIGKLAIPNLLVSKVI